jgi:hypothetical protein
MGYPTLFLWNDCDHGADMRHEPPQDERNSSAAPVSLPGCRASGERARVFLICASPMRLAWI